MRAFLLKRLFINGVDVYLSRIHNRDRHIFSPYGYRQFRTAEYESIRSFPDNICIGQRDDFLSVTGNDYAIFQIRIDQIPQQRNIRAAGNDCGDPIFCQRFFIQAAA